ncbi:MAG: metallophosphatase family protein [Acidobacteriota bacterium]|nr:metallophosphatase family protein [Acidobacteriota bacterium]
MRVGVISDTHGLLRPEMLGRLRGVDHILHAGDVGSCSILDALRAVAPLTAIRGNVDVSGACACLPATEAVEVGGKLFYLVHSVTDLDIEPRAADVTMVVSGHTHRAEIRGKNGVVYLNPGSVGPRRFNLPVTMGFVTIAEGKVHAEIARLDV